MDDDEHDPNLVREAAKERAPRATTEDMRRWWLEWDDVEDDESEGR